MPVQKGAIRVLGCVAVLLACVAEAGAQAFQCIANAGVPARVRGEGRTELVGELILSCSGNAATAITANIQIFLSVNVTSRVVTPATMETEALLTLNEPAPGAQVIGVNVFRGIKAGDNSLLWLGVPIAQAGANPWQTIRITNVRVNAVQAFTGENPPIPPQVTMFVSVTASASVPINNPTQVVAAVLKGLDFAVRNCAGSGPASLMLWQCQSAGKTDPSATDHALHALLKFSEGFDAGFKVQIAAGQDGALLGTISPNSESGYVNTAKLGVSTGVANTGTRLMARFSGIPAGVSIFVTTGKTTNGSSATVSAVLVSVTDLTGTAGSAASPIAATGRHTGACSASAGTNGIVQVPLAAGTGAATWEMVGTSASAVETVAFGLEVAYLADVPGLGTATVSGNFAPVSFVDTASATAPIPRFADLAVTRTAFIINSCACTFSILPTGQSFGVPGGNGSVSVTAAPGCGWMADSNAAWITVTSGSSGSGNGTVGYSVAANDTVNPRSGAITIAGQTFTVNQAGTAGGWPGLGGVSPASGSGSAQTFTFTFFHSAGYQNLGVLNVLINFWLDGRYSCYLAYSRPLGVLYLVNDPGTALLPELYLGSGGSTGNSQCVVYGTGSSASGTGNTLTLTLNMSFPPAYAGPKVIHMAARDVVEENSGWQRMGVWTVSGSPATSPTVVSMSPTRGSGTFRTFTFTFSDDDGWQDLGVLNILVNDWLDGRNACYLAYSRPLGVLYLVYDAGDGLLGPLVLGSGASVGNSQCTVFGSGSSASGSGSTLTLTLHMWLSIGFAGNRVFYLAARDVAEHNSGWQPMGSWAIP